MEIIILMSWSIWTTRNDWIFNDIDPTVDSCKRKFISKLSLLSNRAKPDLVTAMEVWSQLL